MPHQKRHPGRGYQEKDEPGLGSIAVGYVGSSAEPHDSMSIATQKQQITAFARSKQWKIVRWYEESEQSAGHEDVERRPVFIQLLSNADVRFHVVICVQSGLWSRSVNVAYSSLANLRTLQVGWATADGLWETNKVKRDGTQVLYLREAHRVGERASRKEVR
jgi:hypothetical protein